MKIIDNRYRVERLIDKEISYDYYLVTDLMDGNTQKVLVTFEYNGNEEIVDYFIENYRTFSEFEHNNLKSNLSFTLTKSIDSRATAIRLYYVVSEFVQGANLDAVKDSLSGDEKKRIFGQVFDVIDYLHFRGVAYGILNPKDIYIGEDKSAKITDLATATIKRERYVYDEDIKTFISPELLMNKDTCNFEVDNYSLEALYKYLFGEEKNIEEIKNLYAVDLSKNLKSAREHLYYNGKIIGRDDQIKALLGNGCFGKSAVISGDYGIGKSRFLNEIYYRMTIKGCYAYQIGLKNEKVDGLGFIFAITDTMADDFYHSKIRDYKTELKSLMNLDMSEENTRFKFYNRVGNLLKEMSKIEDIFILIDDFHLANGYFLEGLDYLLKTLTDARVGFYLTYNFNTISQQPDKEDKIREWKSKGLVQQLHLPELTVDEVAERIKSILGINYKPVNFASHINKECKGNPRYIKQIVRYLYEKGELYMNEDGLWKLKADEYSQLVFPAVRDSDFEQQLKTIVDEYYEYFTLLSICDETVPREWLLRQLKEKRSTVETDLKVLMDRGLLLEERRTYGLSYRTKNYELKRTIYAMLPEEERIRLHGDLADFLIQNYSIRDFYYLEKALYHLAKARREAEAYEIIRTQAKAPENQKSPIQRFLWERAYRLNFEKPPETELEILDNLLKAMLTGSEEQKSKEYLERYGKLATEVRDKYHMANYKKRILDIYLSAADVEKAEAELRDLEEKAKLFQCHRGTIIGLNTRARLLIDMGEYDSAFKTLLDSKELCEQNKEDEFFPVIYNRMGLCKYYSGQYKEAEQFYLQAIDWSKKVGDSFEMTRPLNNIALLYVEVYEDYATAKAYFNEGLKIASEQDYPEAEILFSVNLAEDYMEIGEYDVAIEYLNKVHSVASEQKDYVLDVLAYVDMGKIFLAQSRFDKAFEIFEHLQVHQAETKLHNNEILSQYYEFLGIFFTNIGDLRKGYRYYLKAYNLAKDNNARVALRIRVSMMFQHFMITGKCNLDEMEAIRQAYQKTHLKADRKHTLMQMSLVLMMKGFSEKANEFYEEAKQIACLKVDADREAVNHVAGCFLEAKNEGVLKCLMEVENEYVTENQLKKMVFKSEIGHKLFELNRDKKALIYLLDSMNLCYGLALQIPYDKYRYSFLKYAQLERMKDVIGQIVKRNYGVDVAFPEFTEEKMAALPEFFDLNPMIDAIGIDNFLQLYQPEYYGEAVNIKTVDQLVANLTRSPAQNVDLILQYMARITFAKKALIVGCSSNRNRYFTVASLTEMVEEDFNASLLKLSRDTGGIIIKAGVESEIKGLGRFLEDRVKSVMVIPINDCDRRKTEKDRRSSKPVTLYLYFETDSIFNKMNDQTLEIIQNLTKLLLVNMDSMRNENIASTDKLTNTLTRKYFDLMFSELAQQAMEVKSVYSVLMLDIDRFKNVNDAYGHGIGDQVLKEMGAILRRFTRNTDLVGRYGGEEFIIVLRDTDEKNAAKIGERIRHEISRHKFAGLDTNITVSIGIAHFPKDGNFGEDVVQRADQALYNAKESGRNKTKEWKTGMQMGRRRTDRLAGIISGNPEQDTRKLLNIAETMDLMEKAGDKDEKAMALLSVSFEATGARQGAILLFENDQLVDVMAGNRGEKRKLYAFNYNKEMVDEVMKTGESKCQIDWDLINYRKESGQEPDWQSLMITPLKRNGRILGVLYLSVPLSVKEFNAEDLNIIKVYSSIGAVLVS